MTGVCWRVSLCCSRSREGEREDSFASAAGAPVVNVIPGSLIFLSDAATGRYAGGGFLLAEVLDRASSNSAPATTRALCDEAFEALRALHAAGFVHGDARLPNLLRRRGGGSLVWIDMVVDASCASEPVAALQRADAQTLAASLMGRTSANFAMLPDDVKTAIGCVVPRTAAAGEAALEKAIYQSIARAVGDAKFGKAK